MFAGAPRDEGYGLRTTPAASPPSPPTGRRRTVTSADTRVAERLSVAAFLVDTFVVLQDMRAMARESGRIADAVAHQRQLDEWHPLAVSHLAAMLGGGGFLFVEQATQRPAMFALLERFWEGDRGATSQHMTAHYLSVVTELLGAPATTRIAHPVVGRQYDIEYALEDDVVVFRARATL